MLPTHPIRPSGNQGVLDPASMLPQLANQMGQLQIANQSVGEVNTPRN